MLAEFDRTRKFADQQGSVGFVGSKPSVGVTRLPGPHYILENANRGVVEEERRTKASAAAAADRWFKGPKQEDEPAAFSPPEENYDSEYGPPGIPMLLAVARNAGSDQPKEDVQNIYDLELEAMALMQERMWLNGGMMPSDNGQMMFANTSGLPVSMQLGATDPGMMFHPPPPLQQQQPPHPSSANSAPHHDGTPYIPAPPTNGMYMGEYTPHYAESNGAPPGYLQQSNFH